MVERYFSTFLDCIHEAGGDINETAGDGFWRPSRMPTQAPTVTAVETALALLAATEVAESDNAPQPLAIHGLPTRACLVSSTRFEVCGDPVGPSRRVAR